MHLRLCFGQDRISNVILLNVYFKMSVIRDNDEDDDVVYYCTSIHKKIILFLSLMSP
jgi:hypothetical protein